MKRFLSILLIAALGGIQSAFSKVDPLVRTEWSQTAPYNAFCPQGTLAGCVAIAMAQVMNYHRYPLHGKGKLSYLWNKQKLSADFSSTWYRWDDMEHLNPSAAQLIYQCGVSVFMDYSPSFSGSNEYYAKSALVDNFGYSEDILLRARNLYEDSEWKKLLCEDLDKGWPIIYSSGGHTFVVDGYDEKGNFHANMGFGPSGGNRYYTIDELGKRSNSTALVHIHPADDGKEEPLLVIFLKDATSVQIPCKVVKELNVIDDSSLRIVRTEGTPEKFPPSGISYLKVY